MMAFMSRGAVLACLLAAGTVAAQPDEAPSASVSHRLQGEVVQVMDGDTVGLRTGRRNETIRLASIDAPETGKPGRPGQPYSQASRRALEDMLRGRRVTADCYEIDAYDRHICDIRLADGSSANAAQVQAGMAWANMEGKGKFMRDPRLPALQSQARAQRRGLWADSGAMAPWQWRYTCWRRQRCNGQ